MLENKLFIILIIASGLVNCASPIFYQKKSDKILATMFLSTLVFTINVWLITFGFIKGIGASLILYQFGVYKISFTLEPVGIIFLNMLALLWPWALLYSAKFLTLNEIENQNRFLFFTNCCVMLGVLISLSANLLSMFIFYEILTIMTVPLISHIHVNGMTQGLVSYLKTLFASSLLLFFPAILIIYHNVGHGEFLSSNGIISGNFSHKESIFLFCLMIFGIAKAAMFPVHVWLPSAMVASYPVSALLHAVVVVKTGLFCIYKIIIYIFGINYLHDLFASFNWIILFPAITILYSSIQSVRQNNIKMLLAFSTINQLNIALISSFLFTYKGMIAAILHMVSHSFTKIALFYGAGMIYSLHKIYDIHSLAGVAKAMPKTSLIIIISGLSLIGIPPLAGFVSKFYILRASVAEQNVIVILCLVFSSLLSTLYMLKIIMFVMKPLNDNLTEKYIASKKTEKTIPTSMLVSTAACGLYIVLFPITHELIKSLLFFVQ